MSTSSEEAASKRAVAERQAEELLAMDLSIQAYIYQMLYNAGMSLDRARQILRDAKWD